jgi:hypothetical protein
MAGTANAATPPPLVCLSEPLDCWILWHGREYRRSTNRRSSLCSWSAAAGTRRFFVVSLSYTTRSCSSIFSLAFVFSHQIALPSLALILYPSFSFLLLSSRRPAPRRFGVWRKWDPRQPFRHLDLWRASRVPHLNREPPDLHGLSNLLSVVSHSYLYFTSTCTYLGQGG